MILRKLQAKDAEYMLEWMHDDSVVAYFKIDFINKTMEDCLKFIKESQDETENIHLAITDDFDEYMGTVSLKHVQDESAELGIVLRTCAIGKSYSSLAIRKVFEYGHTNHGINTIYWCVDPHNIRAVQFYEKNGFQKCNVPDQASGYTDEEKLKYLWYCYER